MEIDKENGNTRWADSEETEVDELNSLHAFRSIGRKTPTPRGYLKIPVFFVYAVKETVLYSTQYYDDRGATTRTIEVQRCNNMKNEKSSCHRERILNPCCCCQKSL